MKAKKALSNSLNLGAFVLIAYASYLLILLSLPYIHFQRGVEFLQDKELIYHIDIWRWSFYIHVFTSPLIIIGGLLQFNRWLVYNKPRLHKYIGYTYIVVVLFISGPSAFVMSLYAQGDRTTQSSFVILSVLWIAFTFLSYRKIRKGDINSHIKWNLRSYALTLSAVTLRFYAYLMDVFNVDLDPKTTYLVLAYSSWIPNLLFVELLIRLKYVKYLSTSKS